MRFEPGGLRDRTEADHLNRCPVCWALLDLRDQAQMLAHAHDADIEICEGPGPLRQARCIRLKSKAHGKPSANL